MANPTISLQPSIVDLKLYRGDGVSLTLVVTDVDGDLIDLSGTVIAQIRDKRVDGTVSQSFDVAIDGPGNVTLSMTGDDTEALLSKGVWDVQWTGTGRQPLTLVQGAVVVADDVTR